MFCPSCGQEQISEETRFCSRCGLLLTGVSEIVKNGGALPQSNSKQSLKKRFLRKKGARQGFFIFLLTFLIVPLVTMISVMLEAEPFAVIICAILFPVGGLLRMAYAQLFEEDDAAAFADENFTGKKNFFGKSKTDKALPPAESIPAAGYTPPHAGNWRDTNDLTPQSVTEKTTKLLEEK